MHNAACRSVKKIQLQLFLISLKRAMTNVPLLFAVTVFLFQLQLSQGNEISLLSAKAELSPDTFTSATNSSRQSSASVAIDGDNRKGRAGGSQEEFLKCASTSMKQKSLSNPVKHLLVRMERAEYISYVRLHLRDGLRRQHLQNGLTVSVGNSPDIQHASSCGNEAYNAVRHGQSPFFICMNSAQYIWIVLRNSRWPLQVCEVRAYSGYMNLTAPGIASLSHGSFQQVSFASNAVDGNSAIGNSGGNGFLKCAINDIGNSEKDQLQFLRISLGHEQEVLFIRLHLRDESRRYSHQQDLLVGVSSSHHVHDSQKQCGSAYDKSQGQSPTFICKATGSYVWLTLTSPHYLQVCEVEVYAVVRCVSLSHPANGQYRITSDSVGGFLSVNCNQGYAPTSPNHATCQSSGNWSQPIPTCEIEVNCGPPLNITLGQYSGNVFTYKGKVEYGCNNGYHLEGPNIVICQLNGAWNTTDKLKCKPHCLKPDHPQHGRVNILTKVANEGQLDVGTSVQYVCFESYVRDGDNTRTCIRSLRWSGRAPTCRKGDCGRSFTTPNGRCTSSGSYMNDRRTCTCNEGYKFSNSLDKQEIATCVINKNVASWNKPLPSCKPITCPELNESTNAFMKYGGNFYRNVTTFKCPSGFILRGSDSIFCQHDETWSGPLPSCIKKQCRPLTFSGHGTMHTEKKSKPFEYGRTVYYSCNSGYILKGSVLRKCQASGQWTGTQPVCQQIQCPNISKEAINNGRILNTNRLFGSLAVYECNAGYRVVGNRTRTCQQNGTWSGNPPICQGSKCDTLISPNNGNVTIKILQSVAIATYSCNAGYTLEVGGITRVCLPNGVWSGNQPSCKPCSCDSPQSRRDANKKRHAVVLLQITSSAQEIQEEISYKAKIKKICRANNAVARKIKAGHFASLTATQRTQDGTCRCPNFQRKVVYAVGVNINSKSGKNWKLEVPRNFYVAKSKVC
ncbi:CUB and sushi domain-containing protein 3-like isoform X3 [Corticium candelabrum]|uniref:CUB and sushi domain-containing protein 3-like isoform X3 n=1 Tax=Corticium candelabrum TaxID=121492 RepID=UPI002E252C2B|nr:CUB and sushi domain-containing protein 3-like isoform X3 [Corticium candelabrum]